MADESAENNREFLKLWRAYRTSKQMCADRGYIVSDDELNISYDVFRQLYSDGSGSADRSRISYSCDPSAEMVIKYTDPPTKSNPDPKAAIGTIRVEFCGDQSVGTKQVRAFAQFLQENHYYTGIFISAYHVTPSAYKVIPACLPTLLEIFDEQDLLVNITQHELVPKHVLLSKEEKIKLLERYRLKETQLPRIQVTDPVARYLGLRRGQVVKIIRKSETAGRYSSYRWCI